MLTNPPPPRRPAEATNRRGSPRFGAASRVVLALLLVAAPGLAQESGSPPGCGSPLPPLPAPPPAEVACDNLALTAYDGLLVLAPHPDDETIVFAGLIAAYRELGKPVQVVVVTDGDAYCDACRFWKNASVAGPTCDAADLSNFATPEVDSFAEVRRCESAAAAAALGRTPPTFLGYPDTGLAAAWLNSRLGRPDAPLRRSDFKACPDCDSCGSGYGGGPETDLSASTLATTLSALLAASSERTLLATSHWLDGHGDHAGLGNLVKTLNDRLPSPRPVAYAVIHAHSPKTTPHPDCWYPAPQALVCPCADERRATEDPTWVSDLRRHRLRQDLPASLPDDAPYGEESQLCLPEALYRGDDAPKLAAVRSYRSQLGSLARSGRLPAHLDALIDCNGYLVSFVRRTEAFVLLEPAAAAPCDPTGAWQGTRRPARGEQVAATLTLAPANEVGLAGRLTWTDGSGAARQEVVTGERDRDCRVTLRAAEAPALLYRGTLSRDGMSLYAEADGAPGGFLVLHRWSALD